MNYDREKVGVSIKNICVTQYLQKLDNNFCKVDIISVKTRCIMDKEKYGFSHTKISHATAEKIKLSIQKKYWFPQKYCYRDIVGSFFWSHVTVYTPFFHFLAAMSSSRSDKVTQCLCLNIH